MCIFVILCVEETYYFICVVGGGYRISNFLMVKEVNKEVKKEVAASVPNHKILWKYEICFKQKGSQNKIRTIVMYLSSSRKLWIFFPRNWNAPQMEYRCRMWMYCQLYGHIFFNFSLHIQCNMEFVKIYSIKKISFQISVKFYI